MIKTKGSYMIHYWGKNKDEIKKMVEKKSPYKKPTLLSLEVPLRGHPHTVNEPQTTKVKVQSSIRALQFHQHHKDVGVLRGNGTHSPSPSFTKPAKTWKEFLLYNWRYL